MPSKSADQHLIELKAVVEDFVDELMSSHVPRMPPSGKVIRDAVHNFIPLTRKEVAIVDSPIVQRLRLIAQTAFASEVYPSANHTRFSHSLGVAAMATKVCEGLRLAGVLIDAADEDALRLAGLLHDVGHCFLSHLSERMIETYFGEPFSVLAASPAHPQFAGKHAGEILSYLIITSDRYAEVIRQTSGLDPFHIGNLVLGKGRNPDYQWMGNIISGPFDADKLDYLPRDCYSTGIRAEIDTDRLVSGLALVREPSGERVLGGTQAIVSQLEQILIAKVQLFASMYYHHKVRALECMVRTSVGILRESDGPQTIDLRTLGGFLRATDVEFLVALQRSPALQPAGAQFVYSRRLLKRCLALAWNTYNAPDEPHDLDFMGLSEDEQSDDRHETALAIADAAGQSADDARWTWLDMPTAPRMDLDAALCWIETSRGPRTLNTYYPTTNWMKSYSEFRVTFHVFSWPEDTTRRAVSAAAERVLGEKFGLTFDVAARDCLKVS